MRAWKWRGEERATQGIFTTCSQMEQQWARDSVRARGKCQSLQYIMESGNIRRSNIRFSNVLFLRRATPKWNLCNGKAISEQCKCECSVKTPTFKSNDHQKTLHRLEYKPHADFLKSSVKSVSQSSAEDVTTDKRRFFAHVYIYIYVYCRYIYYIYMCVYIKSPLCEFSHTVGYCYAQHLSSEIHPSPHPFVHPSINPYIHQSLHPSILQSLHPSIPPSLSPSLPLSILYYSIIIQQHLSALPRNFLLWLTEVQ